MQVSHPRFQKLALQSCNTNIFAVITLQKIFARKDKMSIKSVWHESFPIYFTLIVTLYNMVN